MQGLRWLRRQVGSRKLTNITRRYWRRVKAAGSIAERVFPEVGKDGEPIPPPRRDGDGRIVGVHQ